jgi:hypothetical protein
MPGDATRTDLGCVRFSPNCRSDLLRRLGLLKFKYGFETRRVDGEDEQLKVFIAWEYKCDEKAPPAEREAMKLEREVIQFAMSSLLAVLGCQTTTFLASFGHWRLACSK